MTISVIPASEITEDLCARWRELQEADPDLASPYFAPEFETMVRAHEILVRAETGITEATNISHTEEFYEL
jgi:hypothetical protein